MWGANLMTAMSRLVERGFDWQWRHHNVAHRKDPRPDDHTMLATTLSPVDRALAYNLH